METALKIANKIRAHERFAAYIVIPTWPEAVPTGSAIERILFWQGFFLDQCASTSTVLLGFNPPNNSG
ncbi:unnamed protein product [Lactuca virosa]|uniref:Phospholipase D n=1 Tax=Lactuca virosa TaxID=75947 RepID=A0AAU9ML31_9ASTR|nr:unnamed protein product [Lactuca virosa]